MFDKSAWFYDAIYSWKDYKTESQVLHEIIQQHKSSEGNTLLEAACGTGAHLTYLQEHYQCEGFDLDAGMLKAARERFPEMTFYHADMRDFDIGKQYDVITCLFSSIGYVVTIEGLNQALKRFAAHLKPGGVLVIEPWFHPGDLRDNHVSMLNVNEPDFKISRVSRTTLDGNVSTLHFHYLVGRPEGIEYFTEQHVMGIFTHEEYLKAFENAGLRVIHDPKGLMDRGLYIGLYAAA